LKRYCPSYYDTNFGGVVAVGIIIKWERGDIWKQCFEGIEGGSRCGKGGIEITIRILLWGWDCEKLGEDFLFGIWWGAY